MTDLLQEALIARDRGDIPLAKQLISQALIQAPNSESAWMLMADVVEDVRLRRNCLERVLAINPNNETAATTLTKLSTSPLSPISRGERDKPLNPPQIEKIPPFTPPFTWEDNQQQFLAENDLTYPNLPGETPDQPPDAIPTFDWATESDEPDKTIEKIFEAVSNPDLASQPLPDTELSWSDAAAAGVVAGTEGDYEERLLNQLVGDQEEQVPPVELSPNKEDFTVNPESQLGLDAFTSPEQALETVTPDYRLWDNPKLKTDRMVIVSSKSLLFASPKESDVPHIQGLFAEGKMMRDLLGENAGVIKLESIHKLTANPKYSTLLVEYAGKEGKPAKKKQFSKHELKFSSPAVLEEVLQALEVRLGAGFYRNVHKFSLADKLIPPLITLFAIILLAWSLIGGLPLLIGLPDTRLAVLQRLATGLQDLVTKIGSVNILLVALICGVFVLIWLLNNLRQPSELIILER
jgi:hypothetical protein